MAMEVSLQSTLPREGLAAVLVRASVFLGSRNFSPRDLLGRESEAPRGKILMLLMVLLLLNTQLLSLLSRLSNALKGKEKVLSPAMSNF